jgi:periplasmic divalent cation tolerance protein
MSDLIEVTTTLGCQADAEELARKMVESRLAACVQITGPISSLYRWQGQVQCEEEWRCTVKSLASLQPRLVEFVEQHHPYEVPEILVLSVAGASAEYREWLRSQVDEPQA